MAGIKKQVCFVLNDNTVYPEMVVEFLRFYKSPYFGKIEFKNITSDGGSVYRKFKKITESKEEAEKFSAHFKKEAEILHKYDFVMNCVLKPIANYSRIEELYEIFKESPRQFNFKSSELSNSVTFVDFESSDVILVRDYSTRYLIKVDLFKKDYDYKIHSMCEDFIIKEEDLNYLHELRKIRFNKEKGVY
jgi:uncharacterized protein YktA (UPF0223 family)